MKTGLVGVAVGMLVAILALAGCGGGGETTSEATSLSKAEFIRQGDAICDKARKRKATALKVALDDVLSRDTTTEEIPLAEQEELLFDVVLPPLEEMSSELSDLEVPGDPKAAAVPRSFERTIDELKENPAMIAESENVFLEADRIAAAYGFQICSEFF